MPDVRPDWTSIRGGGLRGATVAVAAHDAECPHGVAVLEHEPIVLLGTQLVQEPDGRRHVDLSGAEWHPHQCIATGTRSGHVAEAR